uniref:THO complex subunit 4B n=1 Tax=Noccaea caerulescens TaxID=107243 RepID=A0A1J3CVC4_NOCCA
MSGGLDMSLDDIIKSNRKPTGSRGRGIGGSSGGGRGFGGSGPSRRFANRVGNRAAPYSRPVQQQAQDAMWQNDVFATDASVAAAFGHQSAGVGGSSIETGTKLYISNLDYGVSNEDIKELFSEVGDLKRYGIHYDRSGRSKGTAEVVYSRRGDALAAVKRYNNVQLDGKLMKIEIVGTNLSAQAPPILATAQIPFPTNGILGNFTENYNGNIIGNFNGNFRGRGRGGFMGRPRGGFGGGNFRGGRGARGGGGGGRGSGRGRDEKVSAEDLDAELDKYHKEAMETS